MYRNKIGSVITVIVLGLSVALAGCASDTAQKTDQASNVSASDKSQPKQQQTSKSTSTSNSTSNNTSEGSTATGTKTNSGSTSSNASKTTTPSTNTNTVTPSKNISMSSVTAVRLADSKTGWVGGNGWIAKTIDGGVSWAVHYEGIGTVQQIFALNHQYIWATIDQGGNSLRLLQSNDGGLHWNLIGTTPNKAYMHFVSNATALSGNAYSLDGGKTWHQFTTPKNIVGYAYFHDLKNGWVVTQSNKVLYVQKTTDGGKTWSIVLTKNLASPITNATIRSAGINDAWIELVGDSGMSQTSYSVIHTTDGGKTWKTVIANSTAGGGPAPGVNENDNKGPHNKGSKPGPLYVVSPQIAYMGGSCPACDNPNSIGWTKDGGKTWSNSNATFPGYGDAYLAIADANHGWWITTENTKPSIMYTTSDGGTHWTKVHTFK